MALGNTGDQDTGDQECRWTQSSRVTAVLVKDNPRSEEAQGKDRGEDIKERRNWRPCKISKCEETRKEAMERSGNSH